MVSEFKDFVIERELGRGGLGIVYLARQRSNGSRPVALKVLRPEVARNRVSVDRFLLEARAACRLDHPNVVRVIASGEEGGSYYCAMEVVDGEPLSASIAKGPLAPEAAARIFIQVALALEHAHSRGVLHRDVKPQNILMTPRGDALLSDFGLAREVDRTTLTASGAIVGTPAYMSPEQAMGEVRRIDARSDVFGLGASLYEALTGSPPFRGATLANLAHQIVHVDPMPPHEVCAAVPRELSEIVMRALRKAPEARYASAEALRTALERWLAGPIRPGWFSRGIASGALGACALAAVALMFFVPDRRADVERLRRAGESARAEGRWADAVSSFEQGIALAGDAPGLVSTRVDLALRVEEARRGWVRALEEEAVRLAASDPSLAQKRLEEAMGVAESMPDEKERLRGRFADLGLDGPDAGSDSTGGGSALPIRSTYGLRRALARAARGTVLVLQPGAYGAVALTRPGIALRAARPGACWVAGLTVTSRKGDVEGLRIASPLLVRGAQGLRLRRSWLAGPTAMVVAKATEFRLSDSVVRGGVRISACRDFVLERVSIVSRDLALGVRGGSGLGAYDLRIRAPAGIRVEEGALASRIAGCSIEAAMGISLEGEGPALVAGCQLTASGPPTTWAIRVSQGPTLVVACRAAGYPVGMGADGGADALFLHDEVLGFATGFWLDAGSKSGIRDCRLASCAPGGTLFQFAQPIAFCDHNMVPEEGDHRHARLEGRSVATLEAWRDNLGYGAGTRRSDTAGPIPGFCGLPRGSMEREELRKWFRLALDGVSEIDGLARDVAAVLGSEARFRQWLEE